MMVSTRFYLKLSLSNTIYIFYIFELFRAEFTVHTPNENGTLVDNCILLWLMRQSFNSMICTTGRVFLLNVKRTICCLRG